MDETHAPFKKRHTLLQRKEKANKQMASNPGKIVIIVQKHKKSILPILKNPRFLCEKDYKFSMIKSMLEKKIKQQDKAKNDLQGKYSFFIYINGNIPNPESTMVQIYEKYKDEDGFLYMQYGDQESL